MGFEVERFDHIVLNCTGVDATASWYERDLGMQRETLGTSGRTALRFGNQKMTSHYCRDVDGNLIEIVAY
ncbi:hypothetical protein [Mycobacterium parmense]|uniref:VOC domain-containing protein n=1 Tax=Mycobacterium parmense TaxID=185642 RepID=A0A7I7Z0A0_9MYCO|nr:hypothetical protein [Mycobacterium parmense]MCV7350160.1 hypothetical protein [Mycobacterium parmense]BBZ47309.1 hypothetical protein MPRM_45900 [Mycobacterium parmense]